MVNGFDVKITMSNVIFEQTSNHSMTFLRYLMAYDPLTVAQGALPHAIHVGLATRQRRSLRREERDWPAA